MWCQLITGFRTTMSSCNFHSAERHILKHGQATTHGISSSTAFPHSLRYDPDADERETRKPCPNICSFRAVPATPRRTPTVSMPQTSMTSLSTARKLWSDAWVILLPLHKMNIECFPKTAETRSSPKSLAMGRVRSKVGGFFHFGHDHRACLLILPAPLQFQGSKVTCDKTARTRLDSCRPAA